jgi:ribosomal protein S18 acetylase RimI-like enzyme
MKSNDAASAAPIEIREMELGDIEPVFHLGGKLFTAERWPTLYRSWDEYELVDLYESHGEYCLVAEANKRVVGFALGMMMKKPRNAWRYGWLLWLGVARRHKRRGIGDRLVNRLTERFIEDGARMMLVDTDVNNEKAIHFFKNAGFTNGIHHIYMSLNLESHPRYIERKAEREGWLATE